MRATAEMRPSGPTRRACVREASSATRPAPSEPAKTRPSSATSGAGVDVVGAAVGEGARVDAAVVDEDEAAVVGAGDHAVAEQRERGDDVAAGAGRAEDERVPQRGLCVEAARGPRRRRRACRSRRDAGAVAWRRGAVTRRTSPSGPRSPSGDVVAAAPQAVRGAEESSSPATASDETAWPAARTPARAPSGASTTAPRWVAATMWPSRSTSASTKRSRPSSAPTSRGARSRAGSKR